MAALLRIERLQMAFKTNDWIAYVLANTYNFNPPRKVGPARLRRVDASKYEAVGDLFGTRTFVLAHWLDKTNVLVKVDPFTMNPAGT